MQRFALLRLRQLYCYSNSLTVSCQCWVTKITLTLLAYHGPSGAGSSSLVCLCVPWYTWDCVKFNMRVCVYLSCWYCVCTGTESGGSVFISVCDSVFVCMYDCVCGTGHSEDVFDGLWLLLAHSWSSCSLFLLMGFCTSKVKTVTLQANEREAEKMSHRHQLSLSSCQVKMSYSCKWKGVCVLSCLFL